MAERKRGCLGCSFPILIIIVVIFLALVIIGFLAGGIGQELLPGLTLPTWITAEAPKPHLPAPVLFHVLGLPVTNTMLAGWITVVFLGVLSWAVTRRIKLVPGRLQVVFESMLGWILDLCNSIAGEENGRKFFPVICTIFLFVLFNAWLSLIPGYGTVEYKEYEPLSEITREHEVVAIDREGNEDEYGITVVDSEGHEQEYAVVLINGVEMVEHKEELIRGANTDVNTPLAIALISFVFVIFYGLKALGLSWVGQYFNFGPLLKSIGRIFKGKFNVMDIFSGVIEAFVGLLELLSLFIRNVSFTFRLFGNMTAGEILLLIAAFLLPMVMPLPFYILELLIGLVQALIFSLLTLVFVSMAVTPPHGAEAH